jgi:hypothetical protein
MPLHTFGEYHSFISRAIRVMLKLYTYLSKNGDLYTGVPKKKDESIAPLFIGGF